MTPFEPAEVLFSRRGSVFFDELDGATVIARCHRLLGQINIGDVFVEAGGFLFSVRDAAESRLLLSRHFLVAFSPGGADRLPDADRSSGDQGYSDARRRADDDPM